MASAAPPITDVISASIAGIVFPLIGEAYWHRHDTRSCRRDEEPVQILPLVPHLHEPDKTRQVAPRYTPYPFEPQSRLLDHFGRTADQSNFNRVLTSFREYRIVEGHTNSIFEMDHIYSISEHASAYHVNPPQSLMTFSKRPMPIHKP